MFKRNRNSQRPSGYVPRAAAFCALAAVVAAGMAFGTFDGLPMALSQEAAPAPKKQAPKKQPPGAKGDLPQFEIVPDAPAAPEKDQPDAKKPPPPKGQPTPKPGKPAKPDKRAKDAFQPLPEDPNLPAGMCPTCLGTTFVPHAKRLSYVHVENDRAPPIAMVVPWQFCPQCSAERDPQELVDQEQARLANAGVTHLEWEKRMGLKLVRVETRHNALHCQMTPDVARRQGEASEAAIAYIQGSTRSCFLTPMRPSTHEFLYLWDKATYVKSIGICRNIDEFKGGEDWHLYPELACFNGELTSVANAAEGKQAPPEHLVISMTAQWNISHATNGRAKHWLKIGFAYHTEYAVKSKVLMEYVKYQLNETRLGPNWANEARKLAGEGKLVRWRDLFDSDLQAWNPPHHLTAFATVAFLMRTDPVRFAKVNVLIRDGASAQEAIEKIYGKPIDQMEGLFQKWVAKSA